MWCHCLIKHWGNTVSFHILTLDLSESNVSSPKTVTQALLVFRQGPVASWRDFSILATCCHTTALLSPGSETEENNFNIHKNYLIERDPGRMIRGDSIYLMAHILFLNHKLLKALWSFIIYQTSVHSMALSCEMASFESSYLWYGDY